MILKGLTKRSFSHKNIEDIIRNYKPVNSPRDRLNLLFQSSIGALKDPSRADLVSITGDLSSQDALKNIKKQMEESEIGRLILHEKPRVNSETWNLEDMLKMSPNSFGFHYASWMQKHHFSSDERPVVKYVQDIELAYIM